MNRIDEVLFFISFVFMIWHKIRKRTHVHLYTQLDLYHIFTFINIIIIYTKIRKRKHIQTKIIKCVHLYTHSIFTSQLSLFVTHPSGQYEFDVQHSAGTPPSTWFQPQTCVSGELGSNIQKVLIIRKHTLQVHSFNKYHCYINNGSINR